MKRYYEFYRKSWLFRLFLRQGIWARQKSAKLGIFSILPIDFHLLIWTFIVFLPIFVLLLLVFAPFNIAGPNTLFGVIVVQLLCIVFHWPLFAFLYLGFFKGLFARFSLTFGSKKGAEQMLERYETALSQIESQP